MIKPKRSNLSAGEEISVFLIAVMIVLLFALFVVFK